MNWEAIGAVGEVAGAVGVIATLVYLAMQIRQNTAATRAQIRQSISDAQFASINARATDEHLPGLIAKWNAGAEVDPEEFNRLYFHLDSTLRTFENIHAQYTTGFFPEKEWYPVVEGLRRTMTGTSATSKLWVDTMRTAYNEDFRQLVDGLIQNPSD